MPKKPKFNPQIARVKLNPEQAVLSRDYGMKLTKYGGNDG